MSRYKLKCWTDEYDVDANLAEASAPILVDGVATPFQTADFSHRTENMRVQLAAWLYHDTPDCHADFDAVAELEPSLNLVR